jgi:hypothetical protein
MKKYKASFWKENNRIRNGGYETARIIEARNGRQAMRKAEEILNRPLSGMIAISNLEEIKE